MMWSEGRMGDGEMGGRGDGEIGRGKGVRMGGARPVRLACRGLSLFKQIS